MHTLSFIQDYNSVHNNAFTLYGQIKQRLAEVRERLEVLMGKFNESNRYSREQMIAIGEESNVLRDEMYDLESGLYTFEHFDHIMLPHDKKDVWMETFEEVMGEGKTDPWCRLWNEEMFCMEGAIPFNISTPFLEIEAAAYASADDMHFGRRKLLVEIKDGQVNVIGEYDGCNLGVLSSYRKKGLGTAFVKHLMETKVRKAGLGYSPEGYKTVLKAYQQIIREAAIAGFYELAVAEKRMSRQKVNLILSALKR